MKKAALLILSIGLLFQLKAQTGSNVEITNEDVTITTTGNGKAYYNNQEIATKADLLQNTAIHARAIFQKANLVAGVRTYLSAQSVQGSQNIVNLNNANDLIVIPETGYYIIDIGPIRLSTLYPATTVEGRLIAKAPGMPDFVVVHLQGMDAAGTTYPGFSRTLYLTAGTILEFGMTAATTTNLASAGEITDNNELVIVKIK